MTRLEKIPDVVKSSLPDTQQQQQQQHRQLPAMTDSCERIPQTSLESSDSMTAGDAPASNWSPDENTPPKT